MKIITSERLPIKSWCNDPEDSCIEQAKNLANLPFAYKHIALMPDTHMGYGMPIGGVLATDGVIIPNAVGVDIGCGMRVVRTSLEELDTERIKKIMSIIRKTVPVGFKRHDKPIGAMPDGAYNSVVRHEYESARHQLGTLGGGNHFIEIQTDGQYIYFMIHSGSRNLGKKVADCYNNAAQQLNDLWYSKIPKEQQLAFMPEDEDTALNYLDEMNYCLDFAQFNRRYMAIKVVEALMEIAPCTIHDELDVHHNYVTYEEHFGKYVWIHRKGATSAKKGELGIIPGSQGANSYIVRGLGNRQSFMSCSHGAGRKMGRKQAQRELNLEEEKRRLDSQGIIHSIRNKNDLDEASGAYKDINIVMEEQQDLVEVVTELRPLAVIKG